jgi:nicotinamidase-related amidase
LTSVRYGARISRVVAPVVKALEEWGLVVVDMQNDFLAAGGYYARRGELDEQVAQKTLTVEARDRLLSQPSTALTEEFNYRATALPRVVANIRTVIEQARMQRRPVAYLKAVYSREFEVQPPSLRQDPDREHYPCKPHSWGAAFIQPINELIVARPAPSIERVIEKHTFDGFFQTELLPFLRERTVKTVVIVGVETHVCVLKTAQSASISQFKAIILDDCVWTAREELGQGALEIFRDAFGATARVRELFA